MQPATNAPILVVQGPEATSLRAMALAEMCGAASLESMGPAVWRLRDAQHRAGIDAWCEAHRLDHAWVPEGRRFADLKLLAMDMDSTLITIECIDEIADIVGVKWEVAAITMSAMRGETDFADSLVRRVALLAGLPTVELERVYAERLAISPGAERMLDGFKAAGAKSLLVSGGFTFFTDRLKARLGFDEAAANTLEIANGRLTGRVVPPLFDGAAKAASLAAMRQRHAGAGGIAIAIGDGANDIPMLKAADVSIAYRAKPSCARSRPTIDHCGLDAVLNLFA
jgi:phosphoserine phosphatase